MALGLGILVGDTVCIDVALLDGTETTTLSCGFLISSGVVSSVLFSGNLISRLLINLTVQPVAISKKINSNNQRGFPFDHEFLWNVMSIQ